MGKHTPGPWCADFGPTGHPYYYILAGAVPRDEADVLATVRANTKVGPGGEEARANALLMATAAELLSACEGFLNADRSEHLIVRLSDAEMAAVEAIRAAVAKAKGGAA